MLYVIRKPYTHYIIYNILFLFAYIYIYIVYMCIYMYIHIVLFLSDIMYPYYIF